MLVGDYMFSPVAQDDVLGAATIGNVLFLPRAYELIAAAARDAEFAARAHTARTQDEQYGWDGDQGELDVRLPIQIEAAPCLAPFGSGVREEHIIRLPMPAVGADLRLRVNVTDSSFMPWFMDRRVRAVELQSSVRHVMGASIAA